MIRKKRIKVIELKQKMRAFQFNSTKDLDILEKYIIKENDYSLNVRENKVEITISDLTIKENDYIIIKEDGFEIMETKEFNQKFTFKNDKVGK